MPTLLEEAAQYERRPGGVCFIARLLAILDEPQQAQVVELLASTHSAQTVSFTLQAHGWDINRTTIDRHRHRICRCGK